MASAARVVQEFDVERRERVGEPKPFAAFAQARVLILLGDPGGGKTHLLQDAFTDGQFMTAKRAAQPSTVLRAGELVFIDGLDEVSGDVEEALSEIISKLENAGSPNVRLSCRAQDWYGAGGLAAFQGVYDRTDIHVCLLLPLDEEGAKLVLDGLVDHPRTFLAEAARRTLGEFLKNPNDLILLAKAVKLGWPTSREDLFEKATAVVLSEQNPSHQRSHGFRPDELAAAAGWISAAVLVSGADDLAVDGSDLALSSRPDLDKPRVEAALRSRAFSTTEPGRVRPAHRTVAEFLAGRWLAQSADTAIHEARMRAYLVTGDGVPPTSLRGVYAWTVNFLPADKARTWLAADPIGLVLHGDVALLQSGQLNQLLHALADAATHDPDLGGWGSEADRWAHLINDGTAETVERMLRSPNVARVVKLRLLDGAAATQAPVRLAPVFLHLAEHEAENVGVRYRAAEAYVATGADLQPIMSLFERLNGSSRDDTELHIRTAILRVVPDLSADLILAAARAVIRRRNQVGIGRLSSLVHRLDLLQIEPLFDGLRRSSTASAGRTCLVRNDHPKQRLEKSSFRR